MDILLYEKGGGNKTNQISSKSQKMCDDVEQGQIFFLKTGLAVVQGGPLFLPPPKKTESQTWGEFLDLFFFFTPCLGWQE